MYGTSDCMVSHIPTPSRNGHWSLLPLVFCWFLCMPEGLPHDVSNCCTCEHVAVVASLDNGASCLVPDRIRRHFNEAIQRLLTHGKIEELELGMVSVSGTGSAKSGCFVRIVLFCDEPIHSPYILWLLVASTNAHCCAVTLGGRRCPTFCYTMFARQFT